MTDDERERPTTNQPLNAPRRPMGGPLLGLIALLGIIVAIFLLITFLRYNT